MYSAYTVGSLGHMLQILDLDLLSVCKELHTNTNIQHAGTKLSLQSLDT